ncbi:TPA: bifunctional diguanylate cyclase/phosphodiesterase [Pseudomonas aeruginosa]|nr:bifunctional diguanylate cyclase/phosphodiesterase [Pseudomonas aeruginosa]
MYQNYLISRLLEVALAFTIIASVFVLRAGELANFAVLVCCAAFLSGARYSAAIQRVRASHSIAIATMLAMVTVLFWFSPSFWLAATLAFPLVILFAGVRRGWSLLAGVLLALGSSIAAVLLDSGTAADRLAELQLAETLGFALACLVATTAAVWLIQNESRKAVTKLESVHSAILSRERQIEHLAHRDALTGLPAHTVARGRFEQMQLAADRRNGSCGVLFINLDCFKLINENMGHLVGDQMLAHCARVLAAQLPPESTLCRQGGDEFVLLLGAADDKDGVTGLIENIVEAMKEPMLVNKAPVVASCSIGLALYPSDGATYDDLVHNANKAMRVAKDSGRNGFEFYDQSLNTSERKSFHLLAGLRQAIASNQLVLFYQPQFELQTGRLIGAEALVRWNHESEGLMTPASFIHLAEASGLINELGTWVLREACRQGAAWRATGKELTVSINTSPVQFRRKDMCGTVMAALEETGFPAELLDVELTEGLFLEDTEATSENLWRLRQLGVNMSIDDFGTGYSNLAYLPRLPVQQLKIDQRFIRDLTPENLMLVRSIIQMADNFKLVAIAEGIEDQATMQALIELGCTRGQGYYWDKPLPAAEFTRKYIQPVLRLVNAN